MFVALIAHYSNLFEMQKKTHIHGTCWTISSNQKENGVFFSFSPVHHSMSDKINRASSQCDNDEWHLNKTNDTLFDFRIQVHFSANTAVKETPWNAVSWFVIRAIESNTTDCQRQDWYHLECMQRCNDWDAIAISLYRCLFSKFNFQRLFDAEQLIESRMRCDCWH